MIFDELGLPRDTGSTDFEDSARLAGIMVTFKYPGWERIPLAWYLEGKKYRRHPIASKYDMSRDQAVCLIAGFKMANDSHLVHREYIQGKDWLSPSIIGHIRRCQGIEAKWYQNAWLWIDVVWNCYITPKMEHNQLIAMMKCANPNYLKFYVRHHKTFRENLREYWSNWRGESDLCEHIIKDLEKYL